MAKQYQKHENGLILPDWLPSRDRRQVRRERDFMFTPSGACGCCGCVIVADDFNRTSVGNGWETKSGTWSIDTNRLKGCGTGTRILWTGLDELTDNFSVQVAVMVQTVGQKFRIFFGSDDTTAYYAEFELETPQPLQQYVMHFRMFEPDGTQIGVTNTSNVYIPTTPLWIRLFLCVWSDGDDYRVLTAGFLDYYGTTRVADWRYAKVAVASFLGSRVGIGGDDSGACLLFDDFKIARQETPCIPCAKSCNYSKWDENPPCLRVTFGGWSAGPCANCSCRNRTVYLKNTSAVIGTNTCNWILGLSQSDYCFDWTTPYLGSSNSWKAYLHFVDGHYWLYVSWWVSGDESVIWRADLGETKPEAMALDLTEFSLIKNTRLSPYCDPTNVTLHVVAVDDSECSSAPVREPSLCMACSECGGSFKQEIRLRVTGSAACLGVNRDGDFILGSGTVNWYNEQCEWAYASPDGWGWLIWLQYTGQFRLYYHTSGTIGYAYGTLTAPFDCSNFSLTLTPYGCAMTAIVSNA